jgi:hypothetical protein
MKKTSFNNINLDMLWVIKILLAINLSKEKYLKKMWEFLI